MIFREPGECVNTIILVAAFGRQKNQTYLDFLYDLEMSRRNPQDELRKVIISCNSICCEEVLLF